MKPMIRPIFLTVLAASLLIGTEVLWSSNNRVVSKVKRTELLQSAAELLQHVNPASSIAEVLDNRNPFMAVPKKPVYVAEVPDIVEEEPKEELTQAPVIVRIEPSAVMEDFALSLQVRGTFQMGGSFGILTQNYGRLRVGDSQDYFYSGEAYRIEIVAMDEHTITLSTDGETHTTSIVQETTSGVVFDSEGIR